MIILELFYMYLGQIDPVSNPCNIRMITFYTAAERHIERSKMAPVWIILLLEMKLCFCDHHVRYG